MRAKASAAGFALFLLTDILSFHATTAFSAFEGFDDSLQGIYLATIVISRIVVFGLAFLLTLNARRPAPPNALTATLATLTSLAGVFLILTSLTTADLQNEGMTLVFACGALLFGAGQGFMSLVWLSTLTSFSYRGSYLYLIASHGAATALCALALLLPKAYLLPIMLIALLAANICTLKLPRPNPKPFTLKQSLGDIAPHLWKDILAVSVFAFVSGFVSSIAREGSVHLGAVDMQFFVLGVSSIVLIVMITPALALHQPLKLESSYRVALPLSALGFLVLPGLIDSIPPSVAGTLATTGYMIVGIVLYCTIAEMAKTAEAPALPLFAASDCITLLALITGMGFGSIIAPRLTNTGTGIALVGLGSLYLIALVASWLIGRSAKAAHNNERHKERVDLPLKPRKTPQEEAPEGVSLDEHNSTPILPCQSTPPEQLTEEPLTPEVLALQELTNQQQEICRMLIEGHTMKRIAQELYLSQSAVKYHAQKIYQRFNVHTRAELNDAVSLPPSIRPEEPSLEDAVAKEYDLTAREQEIVSCLARGLSIGDTAQKLSISENTVKTHAKRIYGKLGIHSKQEVIDLVASHR